MMKQIDLTATEDNVRLDRYLSGIKEINSRSHAERLIVSGKVLINECKKSKNYLVKTGDIIKIKLEEKSGDTPQPADLDLPVIYEDDYLAVISKPAGIVTHPGAGSDKNTLVSGLLFRFNKLSGLGGERRPGIVHRLDKDTSGLMLIAKDSETHLRLAGMLKKREIVKHYLALLEGTVREQSGLIDLPIARSRVDRKKMAVGRQAGREALTSFSVLERFNNATLVKIKLITGRTHQIRVHFAYIGHPVSGDRVYGSLKNKESLGRQFLHAIELEFKHPVTGKQMHFEDTLPPELSVYLERLRLEG